MTRNEKNQLKSLNKNDLYKATLSIAEEKEAVEKTNQKLFSQAAEVNPLRDKLHAIGEVVVELFDGDGVGDLSLPTGKFFGLSTLWWAITNAKTILNTFKQIIDIVKAPTVIGGEAVQPAQ